MRPACHTCKEGLSEKNRTGFCAPCRAWWGYWLKAKPGRFAGYLQRCERLEGRLGFFGKDRRDWRVRG